MNSDLKWIIGALFCVLFFLVLMTQVFLMQEKRAYCIESGWRGQDEKIVLLQTVKDSVAARVSCENILAETITKKDNVFGEMLSQKNTQFFATVKQKDQSLSDCKKLIDWQNYCIIAQAFAKDHNKTFKVAIE